MDVEWGVKMDNNVYGGEQHSAMVDHNGLAAATTYYSSACT